MKNNELYVTGLALIFFSISSLSAYEPTQQPETPERIIAVGDLHGDLEAFLSILKDRNLITETGAWAGKATQLVVVGDYHDRGSDTRYIIDYFMELKKQAIMSGGDLKVVMGNHELMTLQGDLRYATNEELESFQGFPAPKFEIFELREKRKYEEIIQAAQESAGQAWAPVRIINGKKVKTRLPKRSRQEVEGYVAAHFGTAKYATWVRETEAMIRIGKTFFLHGGLTEWVFSTSYLKVNQMIKDWVSIFQGLMPLSENMKTTEWSIGDMGPLWDRSMATDELETNDVKRMLTALDVDRIILGHTTFPEVQALYENQVFVIDTGNSVFYEGGQLSSIEILNNQIPTVSYAKRAKLHTTLYKQLVCRYRTEQGKPCK